MSFLFCISIHTTWSFHERVLECVVRYRRWHNYASYNHSKRYSPAPICRETAEERNDVTNAAENSDNINL